MVTCLDELPEEEHKEIIALLMIYQPKTYSILLFYCVADYLIRCEIDGSFIALIFYLENWFQLSISGPTLMFYKGHLCFKKHKFVW